MPLVAVVFPNEGSQYVGMGKDFYDRTVNVRSYYDKVEKLLNIKIARLCFLGPKEDQQTTAMAHLITLLGDVSFYDPFVQNRRKANLVTGIGVGEIAALVLGECIPFTVAVQYVAKRAALIDEFAKKHGGLNLYVSGIATEQLEPMLNQKEGTILITQYLAPDTNILWGPNAAIEALQASLAPMKLVKTVKPAPRGPLFTEQAVELEASFDRLLTECLGEVTIMPPKIITHSGSTGEQVASPQQVRDVLVKQYSKPVQWITAVKLLIDQGFRTWVEVGPGSLYGNFVRKIDNNNRVANVENMKSLSIAVRITE